MKPSCSPCCRKGNPFQGQKLGSVSNTRKWVVRGDTRADKARDFTGKGHLGGEQEGKGTQENSSATWLAVTGFMVMGLVVISQSFWLRVLPGGACLVQPNGCQGGFWKVVGPVVSPFDLCWTLLAGAGLFVPCSLPGPPVME